MKTSKRLSEQQQELLEFIRENFFLHPRQSVLGYALAMLVGAGLISYGAAKTAIETGVAKRTTEEIVRLGEQASNHIKNLDVGAYLLTGPELRGEGFLRLDDLQFCWGEVELKQTSDNKRAKRGSPRFPKDFSEMPKVIVDLHAKPVRSSAATWGCFDQNIGKDGFDYQVISTLNSRESLPSEDDNVSADTVRIHYVAIGKWK